MDSDVLYRIAYKAEYIHDVAFNAAIKEAPLDIVTTANMKEVLRQLENIADTMDEYVYKED